ncbi:DUF4880 domain-containing protein [Pseudomonas sp. P1B16]|uniref:DUF4880 domain-containing protein n=1 Tax=Pseudomonas sp. P1B16 TaxID=2986074 RepID=UPI002A2458AF|nr:DUF4880 domain-containing protein [Pseudomonas sp. P1B16]WPM27142.1 DUF4880 domain-containing protein [Pseudomonas sp. P1B16]
MNSGTTTLDAAIPQQVLAQAASWLMLMQEGPLLPAQQRELERWRLASADHERAWKRAQHLLTRLGSVPPTLAKQTLDRPTGRRAVLRGLLLLMGAAPPQLVGMALAGRRLPDVAGRAPARTAGRRHADHPQQRQRGGRAVR